MQLSFCHVRDHQANDKRKILIGEQCCGVSLLSAGRSNKYFYWRICKKNAQSDALTSLQGH